MMTNSYSCLAGAQIEVRSARRRSIQSSKLDVNPVG